MQFSSKWPYSTNLASCCRQILERNTGSNALLVLICERRGPKPYAIQTNWLTHPGYGCIDDLARESKKDEFEGVGILLNCRESW